MAPRDSEQCVTSCVAIRQHMDTIKRKILVVSGKEGVGKTTVTVGLAQAFAAMELETGILDADLHDLHVYKTLHLHQKPYLEKNSDGSVSSCRISPYLSLASVDVVLEKRESPVTDILAMVEWGELEYLLIDTPPGSGKEHLAICEHIPELTGAIIVTTSQGSSILDAVRNVTFCRKMGIAILGIVENMNTVATSDYDQDVNEPSSQGGASIARKTGTPFLGSIPFQTHGRAKEALSLLACQLHTIMTCSTT